MKEYIERKAILQHKRKMRGFDLNEEFWDEAVLCEEILKIPAADVAPVVHGEWEWRELYGEHGLMLCCSNCRETEGANMRFEYCPHCGARMDGGNK